MKKQIKKHLYYLEWFAEQTKDRKLKAIKKDLEKYIEQQIQEKMTFKRRNDSKIQKIYDLEDEIKVLKGE